jgi:repressor LexA
MTGQRQPLTRRQRELFDYLQSRMEAGQDAPSLRTAAEELGVSHTAVAGLLQTLQDKGWLRREGRYSRSLVLLDGGAADVADGARAVPIIGRVAAGLPLYAQQEWAGSVLGDNLFALRVQGDSMRDAGILEGDLAICEPRQFAANGEIVVALVGGEEATVKRFFYRGDHIELRPENDRHPVQTYALGEVLIQGKVIGIQRGPEQMAAL